MRKAIVTLIIGGGLVFGLGACTPVLTSGLQGTDDSMTCTVGDYTFKTGVYEARLYVIDNPEASCVRVG